jgi:aspartyl protease family protein
MPPEIRIGAMRAVVCFLIFVAVVCAGLSAEISKRFTKPGGQGAVAMASSAPNVAPTQISTYGRVQLEGDARGHFRVDARVDGRSIDFLVDTGASAVVIRESDAARLGIFPRPSEYIGRTQTANGVAKYAPVRLNRVEINSITVRDVDAAVMADDALKTNLLGMTFLSRLKFSHDHGRLVLEQ